MSDNMLWERVIEAVQELTNKVPLPTTFSIYFGKQLKSAREEQGWSQSDLAKKAYRRRPSISDMENGKMIPDVATVTLLAGILDKPIIYFVHPKYLQGTDRKSDLTILEQELLNVFRLLDEETQKMALKQIRILTE